MTSIEITFRSNDDDQIPRYLKNRFYVVFLSFLGFLNLYTMRVNLSVAIVAMTDNRTIEHSDGSFEFVQDFDWDSRERGFALAAFFYGYITTQVKVMHNLLRASLII